MAEPKAREPMDPSIREQVDGQMPVRQARTCYAAEQLIEEVHAIFPDLPYETSNVDPFNAALDVQFDTSTLDGADRDTLNALFSLYDFDQDPRVATALVDDESGVLVSMHPSARTKDDREPFGIRDAYAILTDPLGLEGDLDSLTGGTL